MDEKPDQIIGHIEAQRNELGRNLSELESRVRETTDWRTHYERNPMLVLGAALGGGILLGAMVGGGSRPSSRRTSKSSSPYTGTSAMGRWARPVRGMTPPVRLRVITPRARHRPRAVIAHPRHRAAMSPAHRPRVAILRVPRHRTAATIRSRRPQAATHPSSGSAQTSSGSGFRLRALSAISRYIRSPKRSIT